MYERTRTFIPAALLAMLFSLPLSAAEGLPFSSSFETGDFSEWQGGLETTLAVTQEDASDGQYSARARMIAGQRTDNYKDYYFGDHQVVGGQPADDELWLQFSIKFDQDFIFGRDERIHKLAILNFTDGNGLRRYQMIVNLMLPGETIFIENLLWNADRSFNKTVAGYEQNMGAPVTIRRGQWDTIKMYMKLNTPGQRNGIVRFWVNGQQTMEYTDAHMRENSSYNPNKLILSNYVTDTDLSGYQWWDDFYLGEEAPQSAIAPPNPPILHD